MAYRETIMGTLETLDMMKRGANWLQLKTLKEQQIHPVTLKTGKHM